MYMYTYHSNGFTVTVFVPFHKHTNQHISHTHTSIFSIGHILTWYAQVHESLSHVSKVRNIQTNNFFKWNKNKNNTYLLWRQLILAPPTRLVIKPLSSKILPWWRYIQMESSVTTNFIYCLQYCSWFPNNHRRNSRKVLFSANFLPVTQNAPVGVLKPLWCTPKKEKYRNSKQWNESLCVK